MQRQQQFAKAREGEYAAIRAAQVAQRQKRRHNRREEERRALEGAAEQVAQRERTACACRAHRQAVDRAISRLAKREAQQESAGSLSGLARKVQVFLRDLWDPEDDER